MFRIGFSQMFIPLITIDILALCGIFLLLSFISVYSNKTILTCSILVAKTEKSLMLRRSCGSTLLTLNMYWLFFALSR